MVLATLLLTAVCTRCLSVRPPSLFTSLSLFFLLSCSTGGSQSGGGGGGGGGGEAGAGRI